MERFIELCSIVEQIRPGSQLDPTLLQAQLQAALPKFLKLHDYQAPSQQSADQVRSGKVVTRSGQELKLDQEPDVRMVGILSKDLRLDEIHCTELLLYAHEQWSNLSVESALGVYCKERYDAARCLVRLFALQLGAQLHLGQPSATALEGGAAAASPLLAVVQQFNQELLGRADQQFFKRLLVLIQDTNWEVSQAGFTDTIDEFCIATPRAAWASLERTLLCTALLYGLVLSPNVLAPALLNQLVELLMWAVRRLRAAGGAAASHQLHQQAYLLLFAVLHALLRVDWNATPVLKELAKYAADPALQSALGPDHAAAEPYHAPVLLAWGLLLDVIAIHHAAPTSPAVNYQTFLETAGKRGALGCLTGVLTSSSFAALEDAEAKQLMAFITTRLLVQLLMFDKRVNRSVTQRLLKNSEQAAAALRGPASGATPAAPGSPSPMGWHTTSPQAGQQQLALVPVGAGGQGAGPGSTAAAQPQPDDMAALLLALAAALGAYPELWLGERFPAIQGPVNAFLSYVTVKNLVGKLAPVCVSFLMVMRSITVGEAGARCIANQFRQGLTQPDLEAFTWVHMFKMIVGEVRRYQVVDAQPPGLPLRGADGRPVDRGDLLMDAGTEAKLAAYLDLFATMIQEGNEQEMRSELQHLEQVLSTALPDTPVALHEPLFRLLCHSVPSSIKAGAFQVLRSLARFKEAAPQLLERLHATAVINAAAMALEQQGGTVGNRFDLVAQLRDREMHQEEYSESLAFLQLVNVLLEAVGLPEGLKVPEYTVFVVEQIMANNWQRQYKRSAQKWQLITLALQHCRLVLAQLGALLPLSPELLARRPMGLVVLQDLLQGGTVWGAAMHVLRPGYKELQVAQETGDEGTHREAAVAAALQLLNTALDMDQQVAGALTQLSGRNTVHPLHRLMQQPKHLEHLLLYVQYAGCADIQLQAIRLAEHLAARIPELVQLLLPLGALEEELRMGYATALATSLLTLRNVDPADGAAAADAELEPAKARADAVLDLLVATTAAVPAPALGHLLLGFDASRPPGDWCRAALQPRLEFSCFTVILEELQQGPDLHLLQPELHSRMLQLLHLVAQDPLTAEPVAQLLLPKNGFAGNLLPVLAGLLLEPLPGDGAVVGSSAGGVHGKVSALRQRAYIMQLFALLLLRCDRQDLVQDLLDMLLGAGPGNGNAPGAYSSFDMLPLLLQQLLPMLCSIEVAEASLDNIPLQDQIMLDGLPITKLLQQQARLESVGLVTTDWAGQPVFNFQELEAQLLQWLEQYQAAALQRGPVAAQEGYAAVKAVFEYAQQHNAWLLVTGAQQAAVTCWKQLVEVMFTKNFSVLNAATNGAGPQLLQEALRLLLLQIQVLSARRAGPMVEQLAGSCRVLLGKLQELSAGGLVAGLAADGVSQVQTPSQCLQLLQLLLEVLRGADKDRGLRCEMYVQLLQYLMSCRGSKLSSLPPLVLSHLLQGLGQGVRVSQLDAWQDELDLGTGAKLRSEQGRLVAMLAKDAQGEPLKGGSAQAVALHLLSALVGSDPTGDLAVEVWATRLPQALLASLVRDPEAVLLKPAHTSQAALLVVEAQLALLLRLAATGGGPVRRRSSAKLLLDAAPLRQLAECSVLHCRPDQLSAASRARREGSFRQRLARVVAPVLRLVLLVLANAPGSEGVRADAEAFVARHEALFQRLLREAALPGPGHPPEEELGQAVLAVSLLAQLPGLFTNTSSPSAALREPLWALWPAFCGLQPQLTSSSSSSRMAAYAAGRCCPLALQLTDAPPGAADTASGRSAWRKRQQQLLALRLGLARQLRATVGQPAAAAAGGGGGGARSVVSGLLQAVGNTQQGMDAYGRPSLLLLVDSAKAALMDLEEVAAAAEDLLGVGHTPDAQLLEADVSRVNTTWGSWDSSAAGAAAAADGRLLLMEGPEPAANANSSNSSSPGAKQAARLAAAAGAGVLLVVMGQQLDLVEQCATVVLLHFVQATSGALDGTNPASASNNSGLELSMLMAAGKAPTQLGSDSDVSYLASKLRDVCVDIDARCSDVRQLVTGPAAAGGLGRGAGQAAVGAEQWLGSCDSLELLNRQLKLFAAAY